ncbi:EAL domain-containing protein [Marinobacter sp. F4216]|uniref:EAL domain-containing response regulator n=1 Tax=Marinobacter sp. F4216 TaxID=2874281 RepID=UPI001CBC8B3A|nr:EAL domain-containing protein [Marinobacter sp. F4216]MBZ2167332.1 EAL domain-containing protein [Marinobacter sp. F4216]
MASEFTANKPDGQLTARILLADDEPRLLTMLARLLREQGYQVTEAHGGKQACEIASKEVFDLALLDLRMPGVDGFATMTHLARSQPDCGVVVVSGESSFNAVSQALRQGALDYIRKPYDPEELLTTVARVLKKRSLLKAHEHIQVRLEKSEALHRYIVNSSPDIVFMLDSQGQFCFVNSKVSGLLGYQPAELCGRHFRHIIDERDITKGIYSLKDPTISADNPKTLELRLKSRGDGNNARHFEVTAFPIDPQTWPHAGTTQGNGSGKGARYYGTARDVTERKEAEAFINYQAYHDLLTRLPNRSLFQDRLELAITHARRNRQRLAVMFLDLDRFKVINDTLGHGMGDQLLQAVAQRLEKCLRKGDTLSRFGGDEFTLLLPSITDEEDARGIAKKLIDALRAPFRLGDHEVFVGVSIGISIYPEMGTSLDQLIQNADIAMYHVKASGKDGYRFYNETMSVDATSRLQMESDLRLALERNELKVFYQPQVCSTSDRVVGLEALVRWQHPERGLIYPGEFLPLAEETRLIGQVSERVLDQACQDAARWIRAGHKDLRLAVNLSPVQVEHPRFVETLLRKVRAHGLPTSNLEIEITENTIMNDLEQISEKLRELAATGVRIAIDDFGTGYSSLNYLHRLPIHTLKVDQSFVKAIRGGEDGACIVNAIVAMAHGLKLDIVAEGVETNEQLTYLRRLGCHQVQGFYYGPARPSANILQSLVKTRTAAPVF